MSRTKIAIDKNEVVALLKELDIPGKFSNRTALFAAIGEKLGVSGSVIYLRVKDWKLNIQTPKGKRGRQKGEGMPMGERRQRTPRAKKMELYQISLEKLRKTVPATYSGLVDAACKGSLRAAIKLKCLDCCCWQRKEIKLCTIEDCSLYPHRPYKTEEELNAEAVLTGKKVVVDEDGGIPDEEEDEEIPDEEENEE